MDVPLHQVTERIVNHPVAGDSVFACEGGGDDGQAEVLATGAGARVAGMQGAVVDEFELLWGEGGEAAADFGVEAHGRVFRKGLTVQRVNTPVLM